MTRAARTKTVWEHLARPAEEGESSEEYWGRIDRLRDKPVGERPVGLVDVFRWSEMDRAQRKEVPTRNRWRVHQYVIGGWGFLLGSIAVIIALISLALPT